MEEGQKRRDAGDFVKPTDAEELYFAFIEYCKFMKDNYFSQAHVNKNGEDCSVYISRPMTIESFRLFAGLNPVEYGELTGDPVAAAIGGTIEDASIPSKLREPGWQVRCQPHPGASRTQDQCQCNGRHHSRADNRNGGKIKWDAGFNLTPKATRSRRKWLGYGWMIQSLTFCMLARKVLANRTSGVP
jgi:hypothetical protein